MVDLKNYLTGTVILSVTGRSDPVIGTLFYNPADDTYSVYGEYSHDRGIKAADVDGIEFLSDMKFDILSHDRCKWMISIHKRRRNERDI